MGYFATEKRIAIQLDDGAFEVRTHARTIGAALHDAGIKPSAGDAISPSLESPVRSGMTLRYRPAVPVTITADGETEVVNSADRFPLDILRSAGVWTFPGDAVIIDGVPTGDPTAPLEKSPARIELRRALQITLNDGSSTLRLRSAAPTLGAALWEAGVELRAADRIEPPPETRLERPIAAKLERAQPLQLQFGDRAVQVLATGETVREAIAQAGVGLQGLDYTVPPLDAERPANGVVQVVRVAEETLMELEPVPFETVYQPAENLELDTMQVLDSGTYGVLANRVRIRSENGVEVERIVEEATVLVEPKPRVIGYGTKIVVRTLDTPFGSIEYWRAIPVYATTYSPCNLGVPYCGSRTASGKSVHRGIVGVIRSWYNMMRGWPIFVPGYGPGTIEDIGAGIAGRDWVDLGYTDEDYERWSGWTTLYFLTPVPPLDSIPWILP